MYHSQHVSTLTESSSGVLYIKHQLLLQLTLIPTEMHTFRFENIEQEIGFGRLMGGWEVGNGGVILLITNLRINRIGG
jgi:hypothetical protein